MQRLRRRLLVWSGSTLAGILLALFVSLLIPGCTVGYVTRQSVTHLHVLAVRQKVEKARDRGRLSAEWQKKIEVIESAREFGAGRLGLPAEDLYRTISLVHPDPNWIVTASAKDALQPVTWWFPVVGSVPYRGYYAHDDADRFAERLLARDLDVMVRAADAFSTLGWFADPIRPAMLQRSETSLVNLVLHEAAHRVVYLKGQTDFNESFASFVGDTGTLLYLENLHGAGCEACLRTVAARADAALFSVFIERLVADLDELYARPITRAEKINLREAVFDAARSDHARVAWEGNGYAWFPDSNLDNAVVLSLRRYESDRTLFHTLLARCQGDLTRSIDIVRNLGWQRLPKRQRRTTDPFALLKDRLTDPKICEITPDP